MMPNVFTLFEGQLSGFLNIDSNVASDLIFVNQCFQTLTGESEACTAAPTDVLASVDEMTLTNVGPEFYGHQQAGFVTDGRTVTGDF
jgi:hypothetical protein